MARRNRSRGLVLVTGVSRRIALGGSFAGLIGLAAPVMATSKLHVPREPMRLSRTLIRPFGW